MRCIVTHHYIESNDSSCFLVVGWCWCARVRVLTHSKYVSHHISAIFPSSLSLLSSHHAIESFSFTLLNRIDVTTKWYAREERRRRRPNTENNRIESMIISNNDDDDGAMRCNFHFHSFRFDNEPNVTYSFDFRFYFMPTNYHDGVWHNKIRTDQFKFTATTNHRHTQPILYNFFSRLFTIPFLFLSRNMIWNHKKHTQTPSMVNRSFWMSASLCELWQICHSIDASTLLLLFSLSFSRWPNGCLVFLFSLCCSRRVSLSNTIATSEQSPFGQQCIIEISATSRCCYQN